MTALTHPQGRATYVLGVGARKGVSFEEVDALVLRVLAEARVRPDEVTALATVEAKAEEAGVIAVAEAHGWNLMIFRADTLAAVPGARAGHAARKAVGTGSVAEAAALAGAGSGTAQLAVAKTRSARATVALARVREESG
ncbi:cobalamin biosynthesis protein [Actinocorallia sp. A-T 12471]|uniref:cobalamin biosynthesis protein n=1 Tax=Actinocorallia sp. A-T 12471 TaxID=3089813 RepID=UPI0029D38B04|nr:cobalamin biosynthesis protein [Actinocorallia sp. A-T 12471]MDX6742880.1 cobalamin biosynthesis protein [Actinocorallia sp. A-T 12471]